MMPIRLEKGEIDLNLSGEVKQHDIHNTSLFGKRGRGIQGNRWNSLGRENISRPETFGRGGEGSGRIYDKPGE